MNFIKVTKYDISLPVLVEEWLGYQEVIWGAFGM